jgi:hypothetical protein
VTLKTGAAGPDHLGVGKRTSIEFFVCAALMLVFGVGFGSYRQPVGLELALAAAVAGAGLLLLTGHERGPLVGIVVLGVVTLVGGASTFSGSYMPGTIVALVTLVRMLSTRGGPGSTGSLPPAPAGGQPAAAQPYLGDQRFGAPAPTAVAQPPTPAAPPPAS